MVKITIIGPGAIGCTLAAWLAQDTRHAVTVAARTSFGHLSVDTPLGRIEAGPRVITSPAQGEISDWVLVATKAYDSRAAADWFTGLLGDHTRVAIFQNGIEHLEHFSSLLPAHRLVPVMVDCPAERSGPGRVWQRARGRIMVPNTAAGTELAQLFENTAIDASLTADFRSEIWKKLCLNNAGALSALLLRPAVISRHEGVAELMRGLVRECIQVGRAEGALLEDSLADTVVQSYRNAPPDSMNSLHADRAAGRPMEIDARNGVIVRLGRRHGIPTPLNSLVVALLEAATL